MVTAIYLTKKFSLAFFTVTIYKKGTKRIFSHMGGKL